MKKAERDKIVEYIRDATKWIRMYDPATKDYTQPVKI